MKILRLLCAFALLACASPAVAQDDKDAPPLTQYLVEMRCYRINTDVSEGERDRASEPSNTVSTTDFKWGDLRLHIDGDKLEWNGEPEPPEGSQVELTASPMLITAAGVESAIVIGYDGIGYFEPAKTGDPSLFIHKILDEHVGLELRVLLTETSEQGSVYVDLNYSSSAVIRREEIPGISLNVGLPLIGVEKFQTRVRTKLNNWMPLGGLESSKRANLTLLKVSEVD